MNKNLVGFFLKASDAGDEQDLSFCSGWMSRSVFKFTCKAVKWTYKMIKAWLSWILGSSQSGFIHLDVSEMSLPAPGSLWRTQTSKTESFIYIYIFFFFFLHFHTHFPACLSMTRLYDSALFSCRLERLSKAVLQSPVITVLGWKERKGTTWKLWVKRMFYLFFVTNKFENYAKGMYDLRVVGKINVYANPRLLASLLLNDNEAMASNRKYYGAESELERPLKSDNPIGKVKNSFPLTLAFWFSFWCVKFNMPDIKPLTKTQRLLFKIPFSFSLSF